MRRIRVLIVLGSNQSIRSMREDLNKYHVVKVQDKNYWIQTIIHGEKGDSVCSRVGTIGPGTLTSSKFLRIRTALIKRKVYI